MWKVHTIAMDSTVALTSPDPLADELEPGSTCELVVEYTNSGERPHRITAIRTVPTWDRSGETLVDIDATTVGPGDSERLEPVERSIPGTLAGRQGFRIGVDVQFAADDADDADAPTTVWMDTVPRLAVAGTDREAFGALVCLSSNGEGYDAVKRLLTEYGYDTEYVVTSRELDSRLGGADRPSLVFGVLLPEDVGDQDAGLVARAARRATSGESGEAVSADVVPSVVVRRTDAAAVDLPRETFQFEVDGHGRDELEREVGGTLYKLRACDAADLLQFVLEIADTVDTTPGDLLGSLSEQQIHEIVEAGESRERLVEAIDPDVDIAAVSTDGPAQGDSGAERPGESPDTDRAAGDDTGGESGESEPPEVLEFAKRSRKATLVESGRVGEVVRLLEHDDGSVRESALQLILGLCVTHDEAVVAAGAVPRLVAALTADRAGTRQQSAEALEQLAADHPERVIKAGAVPRLVATLGSGDDQTRQQSADTLGALAEEYPRQVVEAGAVSKLVAVLTSDHDQTSRSAAKALEAIADEYPKQVVEAGAVPRLVAILGHGNADNRTQATRALEPLASAYPKQVVEAGAVSRLVANLDNRTSDLRVTSALTLGRVAETLPDKVVEAGAVPELVDNLDDDYDSVRAASSLALKPLSNAFPDRVVQADAVPRLVANLSSSHDRTRTYAARTLGEIAGEHPERLVETNAVPALVASLNHSHTPVARNATWALGEVVSEYPGQVVDAGAVAKLVTGLEHDSDRVRKHSTFVLAELFDQYPAEAVRVSAIPKLAENTTHDNAAVQRNSEVALDRIAREYPDRVEREKERYTGWF
jgi:hypothetical protein